MRRISLLGICLVAMLATSAIAVAGASAAPPELGRCVKVAKGRVGKYKDAGCEKGEVTAKGTYEWEPGAIKNKFTSTSAKSTFETVTKLRIACTSDADTGEYLPGNNKEDLETITDSGCAISGPVGSTKVKGPCQSIGSPAGTIVTSPLRSLLGFIKAPNEVGVDLSSVTGGPIAELGCAGVVISITGSVIAPITPISKMTTTFKEKFKAHIGIQSPEKFEGQPPDTLTCTVAGTPLPCGLTSTETITNEELLEINEVL
jgi:hypothetical protein